MKTERWLNGKEKHSKMPSKIAVYGTYESRVPVKQRYWKRRIDGIKQRYWKNTTRTKKAEVSGRYEFSGTGKDLYKAVVKAQEFVPKKFVDVPAKEFLKNPEKYSEKGKWIEKDVMS
jgi:hypothetical protein